MNYSRGAGFDRIHAFTGFEKPSLRRGRVVYINDDDDDDDIPVVTSSTNGRSKRQVVDLTEGDSDVEIISHAPRRRRVGSVGSVVMAATPVLAAQPARLPAGVSDSSKPVHDPPHPGTVQHPALGLGYWDRNGDVETFMSLQHPQSPSSSVKPTLPPESANPYSAYDPAQRLCLGMLSVVTSIIQRGLVPTTARKNDAEVDDLEVMLVPNDMLLRGSSELRVNTISGITIGFIPQYQAAPLAQLINEGAITVEAIIKPILFPFALDTSVFVTVYGYPMLADYVGDHLAGHEMYLRQPTSHDPVTVYCNPHASSDNGALIEDASGSRARKGTMRVDRIEPTELRNQIDTLLACLNSSDSIPEVEPDHRLAAELLPYQKRALGFMVGREADEQSDGSNSGMDSSKAMWRPKKSFGGRVCYRNTITGHEQAELPDPLRGGILADDMGLGKTITTIALILQTLDVQRGLVASDPSAAGTLIICPLSVIVNWESQLAQHVDEDASLALYTYHGPGRELDLEFIRTRDVVLTTFNMLSTEFSSKRSAKAKEKVSPLQQLNWHRIALDEAHTIREHGTVQSIAACSLAARNRWCLTGTPIQNKLDDLFSLIKFLRVPYLHELKHWQHTFSKPMKQRSNEALRKLQLLVKFLTLRRTKDQKDAAGYPIVRLPERHDHIVHLQLSPSEQAQYDRLDNQARTAAKKYLENATPKAGESMHIFHVLLRLRQMCVHPALCKVDLFADSKCSKLPPSEIYMALKAAGEDTCVSCGMAGITHGFIASCNHLFCESCPKAVKSCPACKKKLKKESFKDVADDESESVDDNVNEYQTSTKIQALLDSLMEYRGKCVVFSQWTSALSLIQAALDRVNVRWVRLDGSKNRLARSKCLESFQNDPKIKVILVSLKAGGVGLNLTAASRVYLMEPYWNPAAENQAIDRIYRIGQTSTVETFRFLAKNTVEERIVALQKKKLEMAELTLAGASSRNRSGASSDFRFILDLPDKLLDATKAEKPPKPSLGRHP